jgi:hypothetical protein
LHIDAPQSVKVKDSHTSKITTLLLHKPLEKKARREEV